MSFAELVRYQIIASRLKEIAEWYGITKDANLFEELIDTSNEIEEFIQMEMKKKRK